MAMEVDGDRPRLVLIGYSKGTPDILTAIVEYPEIRDSIAAVVAVAGAVAGVDHREVVEPVAGAQAIAVPLGRHQRGVKPRARIAYHTMVGADPYYLLDGPVDATQKMLDQTSYTIDDFDLFECNEAFAAVLLSWQQDSQRILLTESIVPHTASTAARR